MRYFVRAVELDGTFAGQSQGSDTPEQGGKTKKLIAHTIGVHTYGKDELIKRIKNIFPGQTDEFYEKFLEAHDKAVCAIIEEGNAIRTDLFFAGPSLSGTATESMLSVSMPFRKKITLRPEKLLKEALKKIRLERDTQHKSGPFISGVYAAGSKETDRIILPGKLLSIKGSGLKLEGSDPSVGVYFKNTSTGETIKATSVEVGDSTNGKIVLQAPNLVSGQYFVQVVTQSTGSKTLRVPPRTITYEEPLTVQ